MMPATTGNPAVLCGAGKTPAGQGRHTFQTNNWFQQCLYPAPAPGVSAAGSLPFSLSAARQIRQPEERIANVAPYPKLLKKIGLFENAACRQRQFGYCGISV